MYRSYEVKMYACVRKKTEFHLPVINHTKQVHSYWSSCIQKRQSNHWVNGTVTHQIELETDEFTSTLHETVAYCNGDVVD